MVLLNKNNKPRFILSKSKVFEAREKLKEVSDEVSYSWKTNPFVGGVLNENESCFFSVHSINELEQLKNKSKVWFFGLAWNTIELDLLFNKYSQKNFVVDNLIDLETLINYVDKNNKKINLLLRMKLKENSVFTGKHYVFGMRVKQIKELIPTLRENKNIEKLGVHFHRKTQNVSEWSLKDEVTEVLGDEILEKIDFMNLGGGLPGKYKNTNDKSLDVIFSKLKVLKEYVNSKGIKVIIEPGRFIANGAVKLETQIIAIHDNTCFLNCSIFNGSLDTVVANVKLLVQGELEDGNKFLLKGCTPDSSDILRYSVYLENPKVGDKLVFLNCGAYTYQTDFCALDYIETEIVDNF